MRPNPKNKASGSAGGNPYETILTAGLAPPLLMDSGMSSNRHMMDAVMARVGTCMATGVASSDKAQMSKPGSAMVFANVVDGLATAGNKRCKKLAAAQKGQSMTAAALSGKGGYAASTEEEEAVQT